MNICPETKQMQVKLPIIHPDLKVYSMRLCRVELDASLCDRNTNIHLFRVFFAIFVTFLFNVCAHFHCYFAHANTNTCCESEVHL